MHNVSMQPTTHPSTVLLYWQIDRDILERQQDQGWGAKVIDKPTHNLIAAFPDMKGCPRRNLIYMRSFAKEWTEPEFVQQVVAQLSWGQNLLLTKLKTRSVREWYLPSIEQIEAELQVELSPGNEDTPA